MNLEEYDRQEAVRKQKEGSGQAGSVDPLTSSADELRDGIMEELLGTGPAVNEGPVQVGSRKMDKTLLVKDLKAVFAKHGFNQAELTSTNHPVHALIAMIVKNLYNI